VDAAVQDLPAGTPERPVTLAADIYGQGVGFRFGLTADRRLRTSSGPDNIREAIEVILATEPGERLMRPGFGAGLRRFVFAPNIPSTHRLIEEQITRSLRRWEPRISLEEVRVATADGTTTEAVATIRYRFVATGEPQSLGVAVPVGGGAG
jgi:phage baseplate assembly protein W